MPEPGTAAQPAPAPLLKVGMLRMEYPGALAVDDLSFELAAESLLGMIGPNGSGKTTTLRMLAGILPTGGGFDARAGRSATLCEV